MVTNTRRVKTKTQKVKTEWDKLSNGEQKRLLDDYMGRVLSGLPSKRVAEKIARLKGIPYHKSRGSAVVRFK